MKVLMIQRAPQFSPHSVEKDRAILEAVGTRLSAQGHQVSIVSEDSLAEIPSCDVIFTMGRLSETLEALNAVATLGFCRVINSPQGVASCARCRLESIMAQVGTPVPPKEGLDGYWLKRGDAAAQSEEDVQFAPDKTSLEAKIRQMTQRGITQYTVSAHVVGDLVKFYGVSGTGFFRYYYPTDDGDTKFSDEKRNGSAFHYPFELSAMQTEAERLAEAVGIKVYGGDCIVRSDGSFCLIDFNDWPSFSRCREEAAEDIASLVEL